MAKITENIPAYTREQLGAWTMHKCSYAMCGDRALEHNQCRDLAAALLAAREAEETARRLLDQLYGATFSDRCYHALKSRAETAERELQGLREALKEIAEHPHNEYAAEWLRDSSFATGHTNGHRCCAIIASTAIAATNESPEEIFLDALVNDLSEKKP